MPPIPLCLVEEHHEAFLVWHDAIGRGILPPAGNTLLHIDEHADIAAPRLRSALPPIGIDLGEIRRLVYEELACFEFIIPAIYQGIFADVVWIHGRPPAKSDQLVVVRPQDRRARSFNLTGYDIVGGRPREEDVRHLDGRAARYFVRTVDDKLPTNGPVVLDIDLDFFSCEDALNQVQKLEVTKTEFESFQRNRYHFLRITQGSRIGVCEEDGRYFINLRNYSEPVPTPLRVSEEEIEKRVDAFIAFLARNAVTPQLIAIARSRFSGFTPSDQWQFIENALVERLRGLFELQVSTIDDISERSSPAPGLASADRRGEP
jgi:hypothetical protein